MSSSTSPKVLTTPGQTRDAVFVPCMTITHYTCERASQSDVDTYFKSVSFKSKL